MKRIKTVFSRRQFLRCVALLWALWPIMPRLSRAGCTGDSAGKEDLVKLSDPKKTGSISLEQAMQSRRTVRRYKRHSPLSETQFSQLMWAAQGITETSGFKRAAPSAGALYPMDVYGVIGESGVTGIDSGVYHYLSDKHALNLIRKGDVLVALAEASLNQMWMADAPVNIVITAQYDRITGKYGDRGVRYAMIESGHISQNIFLQAEALGLKAGIVGAFKDREVNQTLKAPKSHEPLLIMPVGHNG